MKKLILALCLILCIDEVCALSRFTYAHLSNIYEWLEENVGNAKETERFTAILAQIDATNLASEGVLEALEWARKYAELYPPTEADVIVSESVPLQEWRAPKGSGRRQIFAYLATKGDERDIEVVNQYNKDILGTLLEARVAGINLFDYDGILFGSQFVLGDLRFFPSTANTGPQAVYVREILYRYWEEHERDSSKIPQELLTMVVSFDEDGNPVSSVDLAKHGLSMPVIDPKPHPHDSSRIKRTVTFPHENP